MNTKKNERKFIIILKKIFIFIILNLPTITIFANLIISIVEKYLNLKIRYPGFLNYVINDINYVINDINFHFQFAPNSSHFAIVIALMAIVVSNIAPLFNASKYNITFLDIINFRKDENHKIRYSIWKRQRIILYTILYFILLVIATYYNLIFCFSIITIYLTIMCIWIIYLYYICMERLDINNIVKLQLKFSVDKAFNVYNGNEIKKDEIEIISKYFESLFLKKMICILDFNNTEDISFLYDCIDNSLKEKLCDLESTDNKNKPHIWFIFYMIIQDLSCMFMNYMIKNGYNYDSIQSFYATLTERSYYDLFKDKDSNKDGYCGYSNMYFLFVSSLWEPLISNNKEHFYIVNSVKKIMNKENNNSSYILKYYIFMFLREKYLNSINSFIPGEFKYYEIPSSNKYQIADRELLQYMFYFWHKLSDPYIRPDSTNLKHKFNLLLTSLLVYECDNKEN